MATSTKQKATASFPIRIAVGGKHSPAARKRAAAATAALLDFLGDDDRIPDELLDQAVRAAVLATDRCWGSERCRRFAKQLRLTQNRPRQK